MNSNFEQDIPLVLVGAVFLLLTFLGFFLQKKLRQRKLIQEGQLPFEGTAVPSVAKRVAANKSWARGEILSKGRGLMIAFWLGAIVWNLTFGVSFFKFLSDPTAATAPKIILGLFSLGGLVFIFFAVRETIRVFRFGRSRCIIQGKAGVLGKLMSGTIRTSTEIAATGNYEILIQCVEIYTVGSGKNSRTEVRVHWRGKCSVPHKGLSSRAGIPFSFELPKYPPETGYQLASGNINWQLRIDAPVEGVDYSAMFIIPVFKMDYSE